MPEDPTPDPTPNPSPTPDPGKADAPLTQEKVNSLLAEQKRKLSERYAGYDDLKKKAEAHDAALDAAKTDAEKAIEAARKEGETTALERANGRLVSSEARAIAAEQKFRNPGTAVKLLDLSGVNVADDGTVDANAIKTRLKELAEAEPYLIDDGKKSTPKPDPAQGGAGGSKKGSLVGLSGGDLYDRLHPKKTA
jgi:multidrug efflux pump subunit AcrA (membrane-fusion protein)